MHAVARHNVGGPIKYFRCKFFHSDKVEKSEFAFFVVEEQVDIGAFSRLATGYGAKQIKMTHACPAQFSLVLAQEFDGFLSFERRTHAL